MEKIMTIIVNKVIFCDKSKMYPKERSYAKAYIYKTLYNNGNKSEEYC